MRALFSGATLVITLVTASIAGHHLIPAHYHRQTSTSRDNSSSYKEIDNIPSQTRPYFVDLDGDGECDYYSQHHQNNTNTTSRPYHQSHYNQGRHNRHHSFNY